MIILLDCDGVLADLTNYFLAWVELRHDGVKRTAEQCTEDSWVPQICPRHVEDRFFADAEHGKHCARLPAYPGARDFVDALKAKHEVWACTAASSAAWSGQRAEWLERVVGIEARRQIICGRKAKQYIEADALIDDNARNVDEWGLRHGYANALLFDQPWNRKAPSTLARVFGYSDALKRLGCL